MKTLAPQRLAGLTREMTAHHKLPSRISFVILVTVLMFVGTMAGSILWLARALDDQAEAQLKVQVDIASSNLLASVRLITIDYAKWDAAFEAMRQADLDWLLDNIGSSAIIGKSVHLVIVWGSSLDTDAGWADDGLVEPRSGLLPPEVLASAQDLLRDGVPGTFHGIEFFEWWGDDLFVIGVSHFEPVEHADEYPLDQRFAGQILMGQRVSGGALRDVARSLQLNGASVTREPPIDQDFLPLLGLTGEPVAYITWDIPKPGSEMLRRILPFVVLVTAAVTALALMNMRIMGRSAKDLVAAERRATLAALTDPLTGLPNRAAFKEALATETRGGERAILFMDLNSFKSVNDSLGHAAGDQVIVSTAVRMAALLDRHSFLARIAGDEFVMMVSGPEARTRIEEIALAVDRAFDAPFELSGHSLYLRAAIGYAVQDTDRMTGADLLRQADLAMYESKRLRVSGPVSFRSLLEDRSQNAYLIEKALRHSLATHSDEITIVYQPVVHMDGRLHHAEVLARWTSAELGSISPSRFVAVAEKAGLIVELGRVILDQVCRDLGRHPELRVSINVSPLQLAAVNFISDFVERLRAAHVDPVRVEIELTEAVLVRDPSVAMRHLQELQAAGFTTALDDFGTGYSSVGYLEQMSFDTIKIDRSFVSGVRMRQKRQALLRSMIQMSHSLDLTVVCEGVETIEELHLLQKLHCDLAQGHYFDKGLEIEEFAQRWLSHDLSIASA